MNRYRWGASAAPVEPIPFSVRTTQYAIAVLLAIAFVGALCASIPLDVPPVYEILSLFVPALLYATTAVCLFNMFGVPIVSAPMFYLAVAYASSSVFALIATLGAPTAHGVDVLLNGPYVVAWLHFSWPLYFAASAAIYVELRGLELSHRNPANNFFLVTVATNILLVGACFVAARLFRGMAPPSFAFAAIPAAGAFATFFRLRQRTLIDVALALALVAVALNAILQLLAPVPDTVCWYVQRAFSILSSGFVLAAVLQTMAATRAQVLAMSTSMASSKQLLERNALRLNGLWYVASHGVGNSRQRYQALLDTATAALRPGNSTFGYVSHLVDDEIVIDSTYASALLPRHEEQIDATYFSGARLPINESIEQYLAGSDRAAAWEDFSKLPSGGKMWDRIGATHMIGSSFSVGAVKYFIVFISIDAFDADEFGEDDFTYIDVLAAFVASSLLQEGQLERIKAQIEHDALTGLATRRQFRRAVRKAISLGSPFAIAALNIDAFAKIHDEAGSAAADKLLVEVASNIGHMDHGDFAARFGADEFGILLLQRQSQLLIEERLTEYLEIFQNSFATVESQRGRGLSVTASIGAAFFPEDGRNEIELMQHANVALTSIKAKGGNQFAFFSRSMETIVDQQRTFTAEIRASLARNEFELEYQPTVTIATGKLRSVEALIRWNHPTKGKLLPAHFIPFAERNGLSIEIGRWVLTCALREIMGLESLPPSFRCYVNVSAPDLENDSFVTNIRHDVEAFAGAAAHFGIEVTESAAMFDAERAILALGSLRRMGLRVAIDDFGTGYSSLSYLKRLPIDIIKIDRSFVVGLPDEANDVALVETLLSMASRFRVTTIAEGVETAEQAAWLHDHGCEAAQGYLYAKAMPIGDLETLLRSEAGLPDNGEDHRNPDGSFVL